MSGVEEAADLLVVLGPRPEDRVDLVEQDGRAAVQVGHGPEQRRRGAVDRVHRVTHQ